MNEWRSFRRDRAVLYTLGVLALALWVGLLAFMNAKPPSSTNQALFLLILGAAVTFTAIPFAHAIHRRIARPFAATGVLGQAIRRGALTGLLVLILTTLRFLRLLTLPLGIVLLLLALTVEVALSLRHR